MARRFRVRELEKEHGDLNKVIPNLVNKHGQSQTGQMLGVSPSTISIWLKRNGYISKMIYVKELETEAS